jgi:hypothetical protein
VSPNRREVGLLIPSEALPLGATIRLSARRRRPYKTMTRSASRSRRKRELSLSEVVLTGALVGLAFAVAALGVGALGAVRILLVSGELPRWDMSLAALVLYIIGFVLAGAVVALLSGPLAARRGGSYLLFMAGAFIIYLFVRIGRQGFTSWSRADWVGLIAISVLCGLVTRTLLGRMFRL